VLVVPSPKFQLMVYGDAPPVVVAVKVTGRFTSGVEGEKLNVVDNGCGPAKTVGRTAAASLVVSVGNPQFSSIRWSQEYSM
jgi:hypothetical protein